MVCSLSSRKRKSFFFSVQKFYLPDSIVQKKGSLKIKKIDYFFIMVVSVSVCLSVCTKRSYKPLWQEKLTLDKIFPKLEQIWWPLFPPLYLLRRTQPVSINMIIIRSRCKKYNITCAQRSYQFSGQVKNTKDFSVNFKGSFQRV